MAYHQNHILTDLTHKLDEHKFQCACVEDVFELIKIAMEFSEMYHQLNRREICFLVIISISYIINKKVDDVNMKVLLLTMIEPSIKCFISVSKNEWLINCFFYFFGEKCLFVCDVILFL